MKTWLTMFAMSCLLVIPAAARAEDDPPATPDRPPELFFTPDTLVMVRINLSSLTGATIQQTFRGLFDDQSWQMLLDDTFAAGIRAMIEALSAAYEKKIRNPFEGAGGSSIWVVMMNSGDPKNDLVYVLVRLGHGLGMKPPENFEQWVATEEGVNHVAGLTRWVQSLNPNTLLDDGGAKKDEEPKKNPFEFTQISRVGEYLVCTKPGTAVPAADALDPTALLAFTQAMNIGSRQPVAWAVLPHKRWRDQAAAKLAKEKAEHQKKLDEGDIASLVGVRQAEMTTTVLENAQWITGWVQPGEKPALAVVVRGRDDGATARIHEAYKASLNELQTAAAAYDGFSALKNFAAQRKKSAEHSYMEYARAIAQAAAEQRKGPLVGVVLSTDELQKMTRVALTWSRTQEQLKKEQEEEDKAKREAERNRN